MGIVSPGFFGRRRSGDVKLPPGQYLTHDFPVLSAGPTPRIDLEGWQFYVSTENGQRKQWSWQELTSLPSEDITTDIHCVTKWSKLGTNFGGVSMDTLLDAAEPLDAYSMVYSYGGYTTNLAIEDLTDGKAWVVTEHEGDPLPRQHGGPARLLIPHLYFWKSAKWVQGLRVMDHDEPGFWESNGYHNRGDPWQEQRYWTD
jgi:DMSO/TMAO reductase YedYZ molybdopterin-dependent catalytic subunit